MTRKRYVKLLMGQCGYPKRQAKTMAIVDVSIYGSYQEAWDALTCCSGFQPWFLDALQKALKDLSINSVIAGESIRRFGKSMENFY